MYLDLDSPKDKTHKMSKTKRLRRRLPAELCAELIACIPPFALQYCTSIGGACLTRKGAIEPISAQFETFRRERLDKIIKKKLMEVWFDVFGFISCELTIDRACMASRSFAVLAHLRLHERCALFTTTENTRKMRMLHIAEANLPNLPKCPPPENFIGFFYIDIVYLDAKVLEFFKLIQSLLNGANIIINRLQNSPGNILVMEHVLPLCPGNNLSVGLADFPIILAKCPQILAKCELLSVNLCFGDDFKELSKLITWLAEQRDDGQPKQLIFSIIAVDAHEMIIAKIKEKFLTSTVPSSFLLRMQRMYNYGRKMQEFSVQNAITGEQLSLELLKDSAGGNFILIARCAADDAQKANIEKRKQSLLNWNAGGDGLLDFCVRQTGN